MKISKPSPKFWSWLVRILIAAALVACVLTLVNLDNLGGLLKQCRLLPLFDAYVLFWAGSISSGIAWIVLLPALGYNLHLGQAIRLSLVGFFFNNLVPTGIGGDVYRFFAISNMGMRKIDAAASIFVERWSAFLALLAATALSFFAALPFLRGVKAGPMLGNIWPPLADLRFDWMMGIFMVLLIIGFLGTSWYFLFSEHKAERLKRFSFGLPVNDFMSVCSKFRHAKGAFFLAAVINLASPLFEGLAFSSIADALGLELSPLLFLVFTPIFRVLNHLPISINAVGTQELVSVVFWNPLGAGADEAVAISVLIHALKVSVSLLGAPLYFIGGNYKITPPSAEGAADAEGVSGVEGALTPEGGVSSADEALSAEGVAGAENASGLEQAPDA